MGIWQYIMLFMVSIILIILFSLVVILYKKNQHLCEVLSKTTTPIISDQTIKRNYELLNQWLWMKNKSIRLYDSLTKKGLHTYAIYGLGDMGLRLVEEMGETAAYFIDQNPKCALYNHVMIKKINEITENDKVDAIIVTPIAYYSEIKKTLKTLPFDTEILSIEDIVFDVFNTPSVCADL